MTLSRAINLCRYKIYCRFSLKDFFFYIFSIKKKKLNNNMESNYVVNKITEKKLRKRTD